MKNHIYKIFFIITYLLFFNFSKSLALTIDEAISRAKGNFPQYKAQKERVLAKESLYKASFSPYLPSVDVSGQEKYTDYVRGISDDFQSRTLRLSVTQILYDFGRRRANRDISALQLDIERHNERLILLELIRDVRFFFYQTMALQELLVQKKTQLELAKRDFEVAKARYDVGVAKKSDYLQASVRYEGAKIEHRKALGDLKNSLNSLSSFIGVDNSEYELKGEQIVPTKIPRKEDYLNAALNRPEILRGEKSLEIAVNNKKLKESRYFPVITLNLDRNYTKTTGSTNDNTLENNSVYLSANWNVFDYAKSREIDASEYDIRAIKNDIEEIKRQISLSISNVYEDLITSLENLEFSREQLKQAEFNYEQAFGEYKVGTGDILSLVQAETQLARARENYIKSKESISLNIINLEYIAGFIQ